MQISYSCFLMKNAKKRQKAKGRYQKTSETDSATTENTVNVTEGSQNERRFSGIYI